MTEQDKKEVLEKLDTIIGILAIQGKEKEEQIKILNSLNFTSQKIENCTGIPSGTVRRILSTKVNKKKARD